MKNFFAANIKKLKSSKGVVSASFLSLAAVILVVCFFVYSNYYERILPNICVEGINIGGMTQDVAIEEISSAFGGIAGARNIEFIFNDTRKSVSFDELKLSVDCEGTIDNAFMVGREGGMFKKSWAMLKQAFNPIDVPLTINFDKLKLNDIVNELSSKFEVPAEPTHYTVEENRLTIIRGHNGKLVNREKVEKELILAALSPNIKSIQLVLETLEPVSVSADTLHKELTAPPKDAAYRFENGKVLIDEEKVKVNITKEELRQALDSKKDRYTLTVKADYPEVTAEKLKEMLFRDTMGTFSSSFATSSAARASNVTLTANRINGIILMPGDVFSYDKAVGRRTTANGYREAGVYIGNKVESGIGGGICQTSSTLYSAALYSNLEIVSRTSHSLPVSYVPAGQDATIAEGYIDLKIKNNTDYPVKIVASVSGRQVTCSFVGVKDTDTKIELVHTTTATYSPNIERTENSEIPQGYKYIKNSGASGYAVSSKRIVKQAGKVIKTENLPRSVYRAAPIEEEVNPLDKDTPSAQLKVYTPGMIIPTDEPNDEAPDVETENPVDNEPITVNENIEAENSL